jgi:hypothetical protein
VLHILFVVPRPTETLKRTLTLPVTGQQGLSKAHTGVYIRLEASLSSCWVPSIATPTLGQTGCDELTRQSQGCGLVIAMRSPGRARNCAPFRESCDSSTSRHGAPTSRAQSAHGTPGPHNVHQGPINHYWHCCPRQAWDHLLVILVWSAWLPSVVGSVQVPYGLCERTAASGAFSVHKLTDFCGQLGPGRSSWSVSLRHLVASALFQEVDAHHNMRGAR